MYNLFEMKVPTLYQNDGILSRISLAFTLKKPDKSDTNFQKFR